MNKTIIQLNQDITTELIDLLNRFVEESTFDEEDIIYAIKTSAKEMEY